MGGQWAATLPSAISIRTATWPPQVPAYREGETKERKVSRSAPAMA